MIYFITKFPPHTKFFKTKVQAEEKKKISLFKQSVKEAYLQ